MLQGRSLKAVFALGAGVDSILSQLNAHPTMLPESIPLFRLEDTGMALQMQEYAVSQVLHWFRRFDDYQAQKQQARWQELAEYQREEFTIGILGAGVLGSKVAESLQACVVGGFIITRLPFTDPGLRKCLREFIQPKLRIEGWVIEDDIHTGSKCIHAVV